MFGQLDAFLQVEFCGTDLAPVNQFERVIQAHSVRD